MKHFRFLPIVLAAALLLTAVSMPTSARRGDKEGGYGSIGTFTKEMTHQGLDGGTYRVRFTIDGAVGIQPTGQGTGTDYAYLQGYVQPNGTITVTMEFIECSGPAESVERKNLSVWMGNRATNGDAARGDNDQRFTKESNTYDNSHDRIVYTFSCADYKKADPSAANELLVNASSAVQLGSSWSECLVWLKLILDEKAAVTNGGGEEGGEGEEEGTEGVHHTEDNKASDESGVEKYLIPGVIGSVLIGFGGAAVNKMRKRRKKNPDGSNDEPEEEEEEEEDDQPDQLEMELYKDFGDTLIQGGDSEYVYACIIRHPKEGGEYVDEELTSRIQVSAGDNYMAVEEQGIVNGWKQAIIQAPESQEPPEEGIVRFRLASGEASYTNKIHFNIVKSGILFAQENLTLPARHEKEVRLPFVAVGMNDGTANVKITITEENGGAETKDYSVQAEWNATNKVYEAVIKDLCLNEKDDEGVPGNFIPYKINIEATNDKKRTVKGELPLNRYYMGLVMQMKSEVNCFLEEHDPMRHELVQVPEIRDGKEYVPAENQCALKLYDWNEEKHALYIIDPEPVDLKFTLKELDDVGGIQNAYQDIFINKTYVQGGIDMVLPGMIDMGGVAGVGQIVTEAHDDVLDDVFNAQQAELQKRVEQQKMIEGLGLSLQARWNSAGEGHLYYILSCRKGVLKAPNRFNAMLQVTALHNGQTYTYKRVVKLMSQPRRSESNEDHSNALKRDDQIREELWKIENAIKYAGLSIRLAPLVAFIDLQLDYYDTDFGYDEDNFKAICKTYTAVMDRESQEAHEATKEPEGLFNITMDWVMCIDRNLNDMQKAMHEIVLVENLPIVGGKLHLDVVWRVSLGIGTLGASDMAIMAIQIPAEMKKYVDRGGNSPVRAFFVGAQIATEAYIMEALAAAKMLRAKTILKGAKTGVQGLWKMGRGVSREGMKQLGKETVDVMSKEVVTGLKGWALAQTSWYKGILETSAGKYAKSAMERLKGNPATRLSRAERIAQRQAMRNIENLQTITEMCAANPTTANLQLKAKIMLECQADKNTMILMKNPKLFADNKLMKGVDFQVTRAKFNSALRSIYDEVDQNMLRELSEASGVPIERIKIMRTSSSNATDLLLGKNATFDRDVTYYYIENGKVKYFDQAITEQLYANNFRNAILKRTTGSAPAKIDLSHLTGEELARWKDLEAQRGYDILKYYDQTPLEDIFGHPESYGIDVQRLVDPTLHADDLVNPHKVAETMMEKGQSRFKEAKALWAKADSMPEGLARDKMYCRAIGEMKEGCRQQVKVFDILCSRDRVRNPMTVVPQDLRKAMELMRTMQDDPTATLSKVEEGLEELNFTMESIPKSNYQLCVDIG